VKFFILLSFISLNLLAAEVIKPASRFIDIMPIQVQLRYEDSVDQSRKLQTYKGYFNTSFIEFNVAYQFDLNRISFSHSYLRESTGNQTLALEKSKEDYLLGLGYRYAHWASGNKNVTLDLFANFFAGATQSQVETRFFGASTKAKSDLDPVFAAGSSAVGRFKFLVVEIDSKILYSTNSSPQIAPAFAVRFGGSIYF
jgi:hypothetical protein